MPNTVNTPKDPIVERSTALLEFIFPSPRSFAVRLWDQAELPAAAQPAAFTLVLNHPGSLRRMFSPPIELSLGEAYIYGDFDIEGDFFAMFGLVDALTARNFTPAEVAALVKDVQGLPKSGPTRAITRQPAELQGKLHSRERDREAIRFHYNVGNDFYALWLDRQMQYSCGYFPTGQEDLDTAQSRKIEHICRKLRLKPGERLLDIGCGWGGLALAAARSLRGQWLGVTLSEPQADMQSEQLGWDWRPRAGRPCATTATSKTNRSIRLSASACSSTSAATTCPNTSPTSHLLKPGGLFLNHGISRRGLRADLGLLKGLGGNVQAPCRRPKLFRAQGAGQRHISPSTTSFRTASWCRSVKRI